MAIRAQRHVTRDRNRWRLAWLGMLVGSALLATGVASAADDASADPRAARIEFWNREIAVLRAEVQGHSAAARAAGVERRLADLPPVAPEWKIETAPITSGGQSGVMIVVNGAFLFAMAEQDLAEGEQLDAVVASATHRLREALEARSAQRRPAVFVRGLLISLLATGVFGALFIPIGRLRGRLLARIDAARRGDSNTGLLSNEVVRPVIVASEIAAVRSITLGVQAVLLYSWLALVFSQFPYSRPWASRLGAFLWDVLAELARGLIEAAPDLVMVAAILALARFATRIASGLLRQVETRRVELSWLDAETAKATRRLTILLIWAFAISASYPHIPGSGSDAFKGISVLVGLMVSLGSAGIANQVMSGFVAIYSRALRPGDYVRVGDIEGSVREVGMLSTKVVTVRREEVTIPNAVLVGTTTTNYSRLAGDEGAVVATSVSIGYDVPWRQVHALLLLAAERTPGVLAEPKPTVRQRALSDFAVEYTLLFRTQRPDQRVAVMSDLHANIQDAFNEFGVQIMTPHYEGDRPEPALVPRERWFESPARKSDGGEPPSAKG